MALEENKKSTMSVGPLATHLLKGPQIKVKDGPRDVHPSGALSSKQEGRGRYDLISPHLMCRLAVQYEAGAQQKGARNWEQGVKVSVHLSRALRHLFQYLLGHRDEDHLTAAVWQIGCVIHVEEEVAAGRLSEELLDTPIIVGTGEPNETRRVIPDCNRKDGADVSDGHSQTE